MSCRVIRSQWLCQSGSNDVKITNKKLNYLYYLDSNKTIWIYQRNVDMDNHLVEDPPTNDVRQQWIQDDVCLFLSWADFY